MTKLKIKMFLRNFDPGDPIFILDFFGAYMTTCGALGVQEGAALWMFKELLLDPAKETLIMRVHPKKVVHAKYGKFTTYIFVANYVLQTYASENVISGAEGNIHHLVLKTRMSLWEYDILLSKKVFQCGVLYLYSSMSDIYIEGVHEYIRGAVRTYWSEHLQAAKTRLARHAKTVEKFTVNANNVTLEEHEFNVESDENSSTRGGSSRHAPTSRYYASRYFHSGLRNRSREDDDAILSSKLFLMEAKGTTDGETTIASIIDSKNYYRICFGWL